LRRVEAKESANVNAGPVHEYGPRDRDPRSEGFKPSVGSP
jgi:hypothetical protein